MPVGTFRGSSTANKGTIYTGPSSQSSTDSDYVIPKNEDNADPAVWDYKTSPVGLNGEALPEGAVGWTPMGDPYFGNTPQAYIMGAAYRIKTATQKGADQGLGWEGNPFVNTAVAATGEFSKSLVSEFVFGALNVLNEITNIPIRIGGTIGGMVNDKLAGREVDINKSWGQSLLTFNIIANNFKPYFETIAKSDIPLLSWEAQQLVADKTDKPANQWLADRSAEMLKNAEASIIDNPKNAGEAFQNFMNSGDVMLWGMTAGLFSQKEGFLATTAQAGEIEQEFAYRMSQNEAPEIIAEDLQLQGKANMWVEAAGQIFFDFTNAVDLVAKTPQALLTLEKMRKVVGVAEDARIAEFFTDATKLSRTADEIAAGAELTKLSDAAMETSRVSRNLLTVAEVPGALKNVSKLELPAAVKSWMKFIPESKRIGMQNLTNLIIHSIATTSPDNALEVMNALSDLGGTDIEKARTAFHTIMKQPNAQILLSQAGNITGAILSKTNELYGATWLADIARSAAAGDAPLVGAQMLQKLHNVLDDLFPSAIEAVHALESTDTVKAVEEVAQAEATLAKAQDALSTAKNTKKAESTIKKATNALERAKVAERNANRWAEIGARMTPAERTVAKAHYNMQKGIVGKLNQGFSTVYMAWSSAFGIRNIANNELMAFIDYKIMPFSKGDEAMKAAEAWHKGDMPVTGFDTATSALNKPLGSVVAAETKTTTMHDVLYAIVHNDEGQNTFPDIRRGSAVWEARTAKNITGRTYVETFKQAIEPMFNALKKDKQFAGVSEEVWQTAHSAFMSSFGDVDATIASLRNSLKTGIVEDFPNIENVPKGLSRAMTEADKEHEFVESVLKAKSKDEANAAVEKIFSDIEKDSAGVKLEPMALVPGEPMDDVISVLNDMGVKPNASSKMVKAQRAIYREAWDEAKAVLNEVEAMARKLGVPENVIAETKKIIPAFGEAARTANDKLLDITNRSVLAVNSSIAEKQHLWELMKKAFPDLPDMPTNKREYVNALWTNYFSGRAEGWATDADKGFMKFEEYFTKMKEKGVKVPEDLISRAKAAARRADEAKAITIGDFGTMVIDQYPMLYGTKTTQAITLAVKRYGLSLGHEEGQARTILAWLKKEGVDARSLEDVSFELIDRVLAEHAKAPPTPPDELLRITGQSDSMRKADEALYASVYGTDMPKAGGATIPPDASQRSAGAQAIDYKPKDFNPLTVPLQQGVKPTAARALAEMNAPDVKEALLKYVDENFGKTHVVTDQADEKTLKALAYSMKSKTAEIRAVSEQVAKENRNFTILNYGMKTYGDVASAYVLPYGFWYKGTYASWAKRAILHPSVLAGYAKYKRAMALQNAALPDWWKQNTRVDSIFGIDLKNPFFFNLEATLWPLNGITGEDFNDPQKQVNWWSYGMDQIGKFGPSTWTPLNWMTGLALKAQGETDAANRWLGRSIPQTALLKTWTGWETDPFIIAQGGNDPYEVRRIERALADIVAQNPSLKEQAFDEGRLQKGELWDAATKNALAERRFGQTMSSVFGVGFKARTQNDMEIDKFDEEYRTLMTKNHGGFISPDDFRQQMALLGEKYPFMDTLLMSRKSGPDGDAALGYNVLSRVPPGSSSDFFAQMNITSEMVDRFYADKGDMSKWTEDDRLQMKSAFVRMSATFRMPDLPTKKEWNDTRSMYNTMRSDIQKKLGDDIWDKVDLYYAAPDKQSKDALLADMPEITQALNMKTAYVTNTPLLNKYYGGVDTIQMYFEAQSRTKASNKYGDGIFNLSRQYMEMLDPKEKKAFMKDHPELKAYYSDKKKWDAETVRNTVSMASQMDTREPVATRGNLSTNQQAMASLANPVTITADQWAERIGAPMMGFVQEYSQGGELPYEVKQRLDFLSSQYQYYDGDALLQAILISMQGQGQPQSRTLR